MGQEDLSKVDTFALGVILVNMLTGCYLFESCLTPEYGRLVNDAEYFDSTLKGKSLSQMED